MDGERNISTPFPQKRTFAFSRFAHFKKGALFALAFLLLYIFVARPPSAFPAGSVFHVEEGMNLSEIALLLEKNHVIRSSFLFEWLVRLSPSDGGVLYGDYYLSKPQGAFSLARRLMAGKFGLDPVSVLIPEGYTVKEMAEVFEKTFPRFNKILFLTLAEQNEGYLFPDTYFFLPNTKAEEIYHAMKDNFTRKIEPLKADIDAFGKPLEDVITMAALLEREARMSETRRMIAGILWKRLEIGMPLQVDAVFEYIIGKNTYALTTEDLQIDSPYNTYKNTGLPPGPIANPGLDSIVAAITPIESPYFFYLSDREGNVYYSRTHEEHVAKKARYVP